MFGDERTDSGGDGALHAEGADVGHQGHDAQVLPVEFPDDRPLG